ncbi:MAG: heavy metal-associated domain-containing protein [Sulfuricurvum sp.]|jgi:copper chaperone CopZ
MIQTFEVENIRCGGCANTITKVLQEAGFKEVIVDLSCEPRKVTVEAVNEAQLAQFSTILRKLGYPLADIDNGLIDSTVLKAKSFVSCAVGKFGSDN